LTARMEKRVGAVKERAGQFDIIWRLGRTCNLILFIHAIAIIGGKIAVDIVAVRRRRKSRKASSGCPLRVESGYSLRPPK
jgi:hypothetical protein